MARPLRALILSHSEDEEKVGYALIGGNLHSRVVEAEDGGFAVVKVEDDRE
jgi:hypothetical protein